MARFIAAPGRAAAPRPRTITTAAHPPCWRAAGAAAAMALDSVVETAFAGLRVQSIGVTLTGELRPEGAMEKPDGVEATPTARNKGTAAPPEPQTPKSPETKPSKKQKAAGGRAGKSRADQDAQEEEAPDPLAPSNPTNAKKKLQAFAMELIQTELSAPLADLALDGASAASRWVRAVQELSANKAARYAKNAEGHAEARKLAADDMDELYFDAVKDSVVTKRKDNDGNEYFSDSKWELMDDSDKAKRYLLDGFANASMMRMSNAAKNRPMPDARAAVRVGLEIHQFAEEYAHLPTVLNTLNESLRAFLKQPLFLNETMFNFLILGTAGVGKTRLGNKMGALLSHFGFYLYPDMKVAQRSDFVADYEGQTSNKVRGFLNANQERVLFLDEAYSLTTYDALKPGQEKKDRKLTPYSQEAVDGLNQYLSENAGTGCFIAAGYPDEMEQDFLPANKGLVRRFLSKIHIPNYTSEELINIYLTTLANKLGQKGQESITAQEVATYFTRPALGLLSEMIEATTLEPPTGTLGYRKAEEQEAMSKMDVDSEAEEEVKSPIDPTEKQTLAKIFQDQASSMVTLADFTAMLIWTSPRYGSTKLGTAARKPEATWAIGARDMVAILVGQVRKQLGAEDAKVAVEELTEALEYYGWRDQVSGKIAAPAGTWRRVPITEAPTELAEIAAAKQRVAKADQIYEDEQERIAAAVATQKAADAASRATKSREEQMERENLPGILEERKEQEEREAEQEAERKARGKARELERKRREEQRARKQRADKEFEQRFGKGSAALHRELSAPYPSRSQKGDKGSGRGGKSTRAVWGWTGALDTDNGD